MQKIQKAISWYTRNAFNFHPKSLALFRIFLGILIVINVVVRLFDLEIFYGPEGVAPLDFYIDRHMLAGEWSLYFLHESLWWQGFLLVLTGIAGILLALGWQIRYMKWLCLILIISVHIRNLYVMNAGDRLLQLLLLWSLVLPLETPSRRVNPVAGLGYTLQIAFMYWFVIITRTQSSVWNFSHTGVWKTLQVEHFTTPLGKALFEAPSWLLFFLNDLTMGIETWAPFGLFIPWAPIQIVSVILIGLMHIGFILNLQIGLFGYVCLVALIPFIPFRSKKNQTKTRDSWSCGVIAFLMIVMMYWWNMAIHVPNLYVYHPVRVVVRIIGLNQKWNMFSPNPLVANGWFMIVGEDARGHKSVIWPKTIDAYTEQKPQNIANMYPNQRWRKFMMNIFGAREPSNTVALVQYMCKKHGHNFEAVEVLYFRESINPYPLAPEPIEKVSVIKLNCHGTATPAVLENEEDWKDTN